MSTAIAHRVAHPQRSRSPLDALHREPAVQVKAPHPGQGQRHALLDAGGTPDPRCALPDCGASTRAMAARRSPQAVAAQLETMDYAPPFQMGHPAAFALANAVVKICARRPGPCVLHQLRLRVGRHRAQNRARLSSGSGRGHSHEAHRPRARLSRCWFRRHFRRWHLAEPQDVVRLAAAGSRPSRHTHDLAKNAFSRGEPEHGAHLADELERLVTLHDAATIAAVIIEPIAGSTGVLIPPKGYLQAHPRDLRPSRHPPHLRRSHHGLRPHRLAVRRAGIRCYTGHHHRRERTHQRLRADGRVIAEKGIYEAFMQGPEGRSSCFTATPTPHIRPLAPPDLRRWRSTSGRSPDAREIAGAATGRTRRMHCRACPM